MKGSLQNNQKWPESILNSLHDVVWSISAKTKEILYLNAASAEIYGRPVDDFLQNQALWYEIVHPDDQDQVRNLLEELQTTGKYEINYRVIRPDGEVRWLYDRSYVIYDNQGNPLRFDGIATDITDHKEAEEQIQRSYRQLADLKFALDQSAIVVLTNHEGIITYGNDKFCEISQYRPSEFIKNQISFINFDYHSFEFVQTLRSTIYEGKVWKGEIKNQAKNGKNYWLDTTIVPFLKEQEKSYEYLIICFDVSDRKYAQEKLIHESFHDSLTGLPNRSLFLYQLRQAIEGSKRNNNSGKSAFALFFLDLDHFKVVNDSLGHNVGDQLLIALATRLDKCLRPSDLVSRLGGDEFAILAYGIQDVESANQVADRIYGALSSPFRIHDQEVFTTTSIGIVLSSEDYDEPEDVLRDADIVLYQAKDQGRGNYTLFDKEMHDRALARMHLETGIRKALKNNEFQLHYQPIVSLKTGKISGFEALLRWYHPKKGMISPAQFVPIAEETGLIIPLGKWVLYEACRQMEIWHHKFSFSNAHLDISVNLSVKQFAQPNLIEQIDQALAETGLNPDQLKLEITESAIMENSSSVNHLLSALKKRKILLSMDDFGTGYSSLSYLHRFPLDTLKIDRSFINQIGQARDEVEIVRTISALAHNLGMEVIAEGIETELQLQQLRQLECEHGQGYFFAKPLRADLAEELIHSQPQW